MKKFEEHLHGRKIDTDYHYDTYPSRRMGCVLGTIMFFLVLIWLISLL